MLLIFIRIQECKNLLHNWIAKSIYLDVDNILFIQLMKIAIDDKCNTEFRRLKFDKAYRYLIFTIEKEHIILEHVGQREETWDNFLHKLPPNESRYSVFDIEYKTSDGINSSKIFFCFWLPEVTKIKLKMLYATGKQALKNYLDLNSKQINISSIDDLNEEQLIKQFNK